MQDGDLVTCKEEYVLIGDAKLHCKREGGGKVAMVCDVVDGEQRSVWLKLD